MRPLVATCHLGLSKLCRRTGKREVAHEHLTTDDEDVPRDGYDVLVGAGADEAGRVVVMASATRLCSFCLG
jgi:hypothetical protein